jgi:hypothetical protein
MPKLVRNFRPLLVILSLASPVAITLISDANGLLKSQNGDTIWFSWLLIGIGGSISVFNLYLCVGRPSLYARRNKGSMVGYRNVSGIPLVGSVLVSLGALFSWGQLGIACSGMVVLAADVGGSPFAAFALWGDKSFWEARA